MPGAPGGQFALGHSGDFLPTHRNPSRSSVIYPRNQVEHRGFTGARRAHNCHKTARWYLECDVIESSHFKLITAIGARDVL